MQDNKQLSKSKRYRKPERENLRIAFSFQRNIQIFANHMNIITRPKHFKVIFKKEPHLSKSSLKEQFTANKSCDYITEFVI